MRALQGLSIILAGLAAGLAAPAAAQVYPTRTVTIVVPYTPGTGADILSRLLGPRLAERWKIAVVTDNRAGATGNIGTEFVAKSAPDGYTLLFTATSFGTNPAIHARLPFDPVKSFTPVALVATSVMSVVVTPKLGVTSLRELLDAARSQPGKLHYASPGTGGVQHLAMELLKLEGGVNLVHVPYKGMGGAINDLVGGHVQAGIVALQTAAPYAQSGKLRMLAVMSAERAPAFADVPTLKELGFPNLEVETWYGLFAPAGTPAEVVGVVNTAVNAQLGQPELRELLAKQGMLPAGGPPERLGGLVARELARWSRVVAAAGIKAD
jgi:tripartite-type tricarboxylate transporter receptor subunit TctC